jgi:hypothetical protein
VPEIIPSWSFTGVVPTVDDSCNGTRSVTKGQWGVLLTSVREQWVMVGVVVELVPHADSEFLEVRY